MPQPQVSVIIPVYNEEKYIIRCVDSIYEQTYSNIELVLIDGGSTDSSPILCDEIAVKWNRTGDERTIKVLHVENKGVSYSRNCGIEAASGEYILFVDGDDWLEKFTIQLLYEGLLSSKADMASCRFASKMVDESGCDTKVVSAENATIIEEKVKSSLNKTTDEFLKNNIMNGDVHCWGRLYKTEYIKQLSYREDLSIGEDMIFLIEYLQRTNKVTELDYAGYNYLRNPLGAMGRPFSPKAMDQIRCWEEVEKLLGTSDRLKCNMLISIMLTASRIALLDKKEWHKNKEYIEVLSSQLKKNNTPGARAMLDAGYKIKTLLFGISPYLYLKLYHNHKA